mgnify:CR=1 FL=1
MLNQVKFNNNIKINFTKYKLHMIEMSAYEAGKDAHKKARSRLNEADLRTKTEFMFGFKLKAQ